MYSLWPTPAHSMYACWDLGWLCRRTFCSELLRSYSRDEFASYRRALLNAVKTWRHAGVWGMI